MVRSGPESVRTRPERPKCPKSQKGKFAQSQLLTIPELTVEYFRSLKSVLYELFPPFKIYDPP